MDEGIIKFDLVYDSVPLPQDLDLAVLIAWQRILQRLGMVGRDPSRYGGLAYGNLSMRIPDLGFVITASQASDRPRPGADDYCLVTHWDCTANRIQARGPARPSSESLTHGALYDADADIGCIMHGHAPDIWQRRGSLGLASTPEEVAYGTPAMAKALADIYQSHRFAAQGCIAMGGHQDGIVCFGRTVDAAGWEMLRVLREAFSLA